MRINIKFSGSERRPLSVPTVELGEVHSAVESIIADIQKHILIFEKGLLDLSIGECKSRICEHRIRDGDITGMNLSAYLDLKLLLLRITPISKGKVSAYDYEKVKYLADDKLMSFELVLMKLNNFIDKNRHTSNNYPMVGLVNVFIRRVKLRRLIYLRSLGRNASQNPPQPDVGGD
jgi:hypothetical protein